MNLEPLKHIERPTTSLILIVDDIPKNIQLLGNILSNHGYNIAVATNGKQALAIINKKPPDLVLLDVMMPEMDGFEVCQHIRTNAASREIPVVFLTAKHEVEDKIKGFEVGGSDYITKPFETAEVIARVHTHLKLKNALDTIRTYNHRLEEIVEERTEALVRAERHAAFSMLIQGIVHNLRNPLNAISGALQLIEMEKRRANLNLADKTKVDWEKASKSYHSIWHYAEMAKSGTDRMIQMISSLMAKSRSDKSGETEKVDMNHLLRQEIEFLSADNTFKNHVHKEIRLSETEMFVTVIPVEISQVFQNLVRNALDAMYEQPEATITIESGRSGDNVWFSVRDNGPGITPENQKHIFDPFFTTKPKTDSDSNKPKGTGLGLHMCAQMIAFYGGEIKVESEIGKGAAFIVSLPPKKRAVQPTAHQPASTMPVDIS